MPDWSSCMSFRCCRAVSAVAGQADGAPDRRRWPGAGAQHIAATQVSPILPAIPWSSHRLKANRPSRCHGAVNPGRSCHLYRQPERPLCLGGIQSSCSYPIRTLAYRRHPLSSLLTSSLCPEHVSYCGRAPAWTRIALPVKTRSPIFMAETGQ